MVHFIWPKFPRNFNGSGCYSFCAFYNNISNQFNLYVWNQKRNKLNQIFEYSFCFNLVFSLKNFIGLNLLNYSNNLKLKSSLKYTLIFRKWVFSYEFQNIKKNLFIWIEDKKHIWNANAFLYSRPRAKENIKFFQHSFSIHFCLLSFLYFKFKRFHVPIYFNGNNSS